MYALSARLSLWPSVIKCRGGSLESALVLTTITITNQRACHWQGQLNWTAHRERWQKNIYTAPDYRRAGLKGHLIVEGVWRGVVQGSGEMATSHQTTTPVPRPYPCSLVVRIPSLCFFFFVVCHSRKFQLSTNSRHGTANRAASPSFEWSGSAEVVATGVGNWGKRKGAWNRSGAIFKVSRGNVCCYFSLPGFS